MIIRDDTLSLNLINAMNSNTRAQSKTLEKLSGGFRINRAGDDASGLCISEKMQAQIRGLSQAQRNSQDAISLIQVADGALQEVHSCLQRIDELLVQSSTATYSNGDRNNIQSEISALLNEVDHIADSTKFNNISLLDGSQSSGISDSAKNKFVSWLNGSWLQDAATKVESTTGWKLNSGTSLSVKFEKLIGSAVASMSGWYLGSDLKLSVNTDYMQGDLTYQGTDGPTLGGIPTDRLITHEMVHGFMFNNVSTTATPKSWFIEGLAEAVHGASDNRYYGFEQGYNSDFKSINDELQSFDFTSSGNDSKNYTIGFIATSYLYTKVEAKSSGSFKTMLGEMNQADETFEQLVCKYTGAADYSSFVTTMKNTADAALTSNKFNDDFLVKECGINLTDGKADPLTGGDASSSDVISNIGAEVKPSASSTTLKLGSTDVTVNWSTDADANANSGGIVLQIGDTANQSMVMEIKSVKTADLGIDKISASAQEDAQKSIELCQTAINTISDMRGTLGAYQNRLEHTMFNLSTTEENTTSAFSRIHDTDMAKEMLNYMKNNVLAQSNQFLFSHVKQIPNQVLQLLQ